MYALFAFIGGQWGFAGVDPHEECAVMFIDDIDGQFGEGTAQVFKFPDKEGFSPLADEAEHHANAENMKGLLESLEKGELDLDTALRNLNERR